MNDDEPVQGQWYGDIQFNCWTHENPEIACCTWDDGSLGQWCEISRANMLSIVAGARSGTRMYCPLCEAHEDA